MTAPAASPVSTARTVRMLHGILAASVVMIAVVFVALSEVLHLPPVMGDQALMGNAMAGVGVIMVALALAILRPKVPERRPDQTTDAFWDDVPTRGGALLVWAVCEGGGMVGAVGYRLTAQPFTLAAVAVALIAMMFTRPGALERTV